MAQDEFATKPEPKGSQKKSSSDFDHAVEKLIDKTEQSRLAHMQRYRFRGFVSKSATITLITIGGLGFGWFTFMATDLARGFACIVLAVALSFGISRWAHMPLMRYKAEYKTRFMPAMAKLVGGLKFHPTRGISASLLPKTGIVPRFDAYKAEDCLMGTYKGVKIILSEARLSTKGGDLLVFDGVFAMLEMPKANFEGHTILTSNTHYIMEWEGSRWQKLSPVPLGDFRHEEKLQAFSDKPEEALKLINDNLLKELAEIGELFGDGPISACFFAKSRLFMTIPCAEDLFEPSNLYVPITTKRNARRLKDEIDKLRSIVDILDLYKKSGA